MPRVQAALTFKRMIPKSGNRFSDKIMCKQKELNDWIERIKH